MNVTAITCTSDRPEAFKLMELFMSRQTIKVTQHLVLDDGNTPAVCTQGEQHIYCPECRAGTSMINKLKIAFSPGMITGDIAVLVEDDDAYSPTWIETCVKNLSDGKIDIFGEGRAIYYNVRDRWWFEHGNMAHASLCSTAITKRLFPLALRLCSDPNPFFDDRLWRNAPSNRRRILDPLTNGGKRLVVGIKAMPGKVGYGSGHTKVDRNAKPDPNGTKLIELIGTDCSLYDKFWSGYVEPMNLKVPAHTETGRVHGPKWAKWLAHLIDQPNITGLEIGTFRGDSAEWMCENVFTHETARYICVDPFHGSVEHKIAGIDCSTNEAFARERLAPFKQCQVVKDYSENYLRRFVGELDFLLVDGRHDSIGVLRDAVMGFEALKVGGTMVFDDYGWQVMPRELDRPKIAIDAFLKCYADYVELLDPPAWQVAIRRTK